MKTETIIQVALGLTICAFVIVSKSLKAIYISKIQKHMAFITAKTVFWEREMGLFWYILNHVSVHFNFDADLKLSADDLEYCEEILETFRKEIIETLSDLLLDPGRRFELRFSKLRQIARMTHQEFFMYALMRFLDRHNAHYDLSDFAIAFWKLYLLSVEYYAEKCRFHPYPLFLDSEKNLAKKRIRDNQ
jgi:hypothetical protein